MPWLISGLTLWAPALVMKMNFVVGDLISGRNQANKMKWNPELRLFETTVLLKEGSYRYTYATRNSTQLDIVELEVALPRETNGIQDFTEIEPTIRPYLFIGGSTTARIRLAKVLKKF